MAQNAGWMPRRPNFAAEMYKKTIDHEGLSADQPELFLDMAPARIYLAAVLLSSPSHMLHMHRHLFLGLGILLCALGAKAQQRFLITDFHYYTADPLLYPNYTADRPVADTLYQLVQMAIQDRYPGATAEVYRPGSIYAINPQEFQWPPKMDFARDQHDAFAFVRMEMTQPAQVLNKTFVTLRLTIELTDPRKKKIFKNTVKVKRRLVSEDRTNYSSVLSREQFMDMCEEGLLALFVEDYESGRKTLERMPYQLPAAFVQRAKTYQLRVSNFENAFELSDETGEVRADYRVRQRFMAEWDLEFGIKDVYTRQLLLNTYRILDKKSGKDYFVRTRTDGDLIGGVISSLGDLRLVFTEDDRNGRRIGEVKDLSDQSGSLGGHFVVEAVFEGRRYQIIRLNGSFFWEIKDDQGQLVAFFDLSRNRLRERGATISLIDERFGDASFGYLAARIIEREWRRINARSETR